MEFVALIPCAIFALVGLALFHNGRKRAESLDKTAKNIEAIPRVKGGEVAHNAQKTIKMSGRIVAPAGVLTSPIQRVKCAFYRLIVDEERTETVQTNKGTRTRKVWVTIVDSAKSVVCGVEDKDGAIEVSLAEALTLLQSEGHQQSSLFGDVSPHLRELIEDEYGVNTQGWIRKTKLRVREQLLEVGQKVLVMGKVKLVRTNRGIRPRFVRGKDPLVVTDRNEKELSELFKKAVSRAKLFTIGGAALGGLGLAFGLGAFLLLGTMRFVMGRPLFSFPGSFAAAPRDPVDEVLKGMKSNDKWVRRRSVDPLSKGPQGEFAARKADLKKGLMTLLADQDNAVYPEAARVLPMWAEKEDVPGLVIMLDDNRKEIVRAAAQSLGKLKEESALPAMQAKFVSDPEGIGPALKPFGPKIESFAADHLFHENQKVRAEAVKLMEGQPNRAKLWFDRALAALANDKQRRQASEWLGQANLSDEQKVQAANAIAKVLEDKAVKIPDELAVVFGETATKDHVPLLVELTKNRHDPVRRNALKGLARLGDERGLPAMADLFPRDPDGTIKMLKGYGEKSEAVLAAFLFDPNSRLRDKAIEALKDSKNRDKLFLDGAKTALDGTDVGRQKGALEWLAKSPPTADSRKSLAPLLAKLLSSKDRSVAEQAVKLLAPDATKDQGPELIEALKSPSAEVRKGVLAILQKVKVDGALPAIAEQFAANPAEAMPALKSFGEAAEPHFAKYLFSRNKSVREKSEEALADSPRRNALYFTEALAALESKERDVPEMALTWMEKTTFTPEQMKTAAPALTKIVEKGQRISSKAMVILTKNAAPGFVAEIAIGTKSKLADVRKNAVTALAKIGDEKACAALCYCLLGPSRGGAVDALKKLKGPGETAVRTWLMNKSYGTDKSGKAAAAEACKILGAIGGTDSLTILEELSKDSDKGIAGAAKGAMNAIKKRK
jgi:HEAT repeat protein